MMKKFVFWFCVLSLIITGCCLTSMRYDERRVEKNTPSMLHQYKTVALVTNDEHFWRPYCAGVWVSNTTILTAAHCLESEQEDDPDVPEKIKNLLRLINKSSHFPTPVGKQVSYLTYDDVGESMQVPVSEDARLGRVIVYEPDDDLALIEVDKRTVPHEHPIARLSKERIHDGEKAMIVGHPIGYWWTIAPGLVSHTRIMGHPDNPRMGTKMLHINGNVWFGVSGGGAFNDDGCLIGISSKIDSNGPGLAFFIHRDLILELLIRNQIIPNDRLRQ